MPYIEVGGPKRDLETKRELVARLTDLIAEMYGVPKEAITIVIQENSPENVGSGGVLLADKRR